MKRIAITSLILLLLTNARSQTPARSISIDFAHKGAGIAPMYGVFFEEIGHAGEGGLYGELLRNRSFEDNILVPTTTYDSGFMVCSHLKNYDQYRTQMTGGYTDFWIKFDTSMLQGWELKFSGNASATVQQTTKDPLYTSAPHNIQLTIGRGGKEDMVSLINSGFSGFYYDMKGKPYRYNVYNIPKVLAPYGLSLNSNEKYNYRLIIKAADDYKGDLTVKMLTAEGKEIGRQVMRIKKKNSWQEYTGQMQPSETVSNGKFSISFNGTGTVWVDYTSLMPASTYKDRSNGLRKDIATMVADLKPAFIRWPGGCIVEGMTLANRYKWKETLGDPASRPGEFDLWGYRNSYGFGYHEFLQYCEDIGASGMFVCNVGLSCLYRNGDYCSNDSVSYFIQDALDAIEYAIGDVHTTWGAKRAAAGHPAPFPLKYIEVGNENRYQIYAERYDRFYKAIKEKYPQMTIISNYGVDEASEFGGPGRPIDMIDPHWYVAPDFFYSHSDIFDPVGPRPTYKIYVGEYSANQNVGAGDLDGALSEAAFAMGMERNSDLVKMCSYAPLFQHTGDTTWPVNMIIFKTDSVFGRTSYYVQKMLSGNRPDINLNTTLTEDAKSMDLKSMGRLVRHYSIAGYDEKNNEIVVKVVNGEPEPYHTTIDLKNAGVLAADGTAIVLSASSGRAENSFAEPWKVSPRTSPVTGISNTFDYEFKPFSFTVLRIKRATGNNQGVTLSK